MVTRYDLTAEDLRRIIEYDPKTGVFRWLVDRSRRVKAGDVAGHKCSRGYIIIRICQKHFKAHRLAWLYVHGHFPADYIDHIDGNKGNNSLSNLREATHAENRLNNTAVGVYFEGNSKTRPYRSFFCSRGKRIDLGRFATFEEGRRAYLKATISANGQFAAALGAQRSASTW